MTIGPFSRFKCTAGRTRTTIIYTEIVHTSFAATLDAAESSETEFHRGRGLDVLSP